MDIQDYIGTISALLPDDGTVQKLQELRRLNEAEVIALRDDVVNVQKLGHELGTTFVKACPSDWPTDLLPPSNESLFSWIRDIATAKTCNSLSLVAGDSRGHYRVRKGPQGESLNTF